MQKLPRAFAHYSLPFWPSWPEDPPDDVMRAQLSFTLLPSSLSQPPVPVCGRGTQQRLGRAEAAQAAEERAAGCSRTREVAEQGE